MIKHTTVYALVLIATTATVSKSVLDVYSKRMCPHVRGREERKEEKERKRKKRKRKEKKEKETRRKIPNVPSFHSIELP